MDKKEKIDTLLDIYEGNSCCGTNEIADMMDDVMAAKDLQCLQAIDEAVNRKWRKPVDVDAEWKKFEARKLGGASPRRKTIPLWTVAIAAACVVLAVLLVTYEGVFDNSEVTDIKITHYADVPKVTKEEEKSVVKSVTVGKKSMNEVAVDGKRMLSMTLADGTRVWLNSNSRLRYADDFSKTNRKVELDGEAFFDVAHDSDHPFIIKSKDVTTKVLGTKFNVRCYDANDIHVTLVEGSVVVQAPDGKVTLTPDHDASFNDRTLIVQEVNTRDFTCWREGVMYFDNATLRTILKQISGWYGVNVICRDNELLDKRFHYVYKLDESLDEAIGVLNESSNLGIVVSDSTILID
ncbi:MAG: FecR family protein [Prevotella sp.]